MKQPAILNLRQVYEYQCPQCSKVIASMNKYQAKYNFDTHMAKHKRQDQHKKEVNK